MKKTCVPTFLAVLLVFFAAAGVRAENHMDVLRVQFSKMAPWKLGDRGTERGVDIDFMRELARRMNMEVEFVHVPFSRGLEYMKSGTIDLMTGVLYSDKRDDYMYFIQPPYHTHSNKAFYVRKDTGRDIRTYEDLYGLRIGTTFGSRYFPRFDADKGLHKRPVYKTTLNIKKLLDKRIDVAIISETAGDYLLESMNVDGLIKKSEYLYTDENRVFMTLSKQSPYVDRIDEFRACMKALVESGKRERIKLEYIDMMN